MDLTEFLANLRTDLKDTGTLWSNAELTRSIERAVDDLSRFLPRERIYETTLIQTVTDESFTTPSVQLATAFASAVSINGEVDGATLSITDFTPDIPRPLSVTLNDLNSSVNALTLTIKGCDQDGNYIEESWYLKDMVPATALTGDLYFKRIFQIELHNVSGNGPGDSISVGNGLAYEVWIQLANPIKPETEVVTNTDGDTTYVRDTDYYMDYVNGRIMFTDAGDMEVNTEYYISYTKSRHAVDISAIIPELSRIVRVEYPVDKMPQQIVAFGIWENMMTIGSQKPGESQTYLNDKEHIAIYYETNHKPPSDGGPGSYPAYLDQVVSIGAGGYALLIEALQHEQQAALDLAAIRLELGYTTAVHVLITTALNTVTDYINEAHTQIGKMDTYLVDTVGSGTDCAKDVLANITDDIDELRSAIAGALEAGDNYLDDVSDIDLDQTTVGASGLLDAGDGLIDQLNDGENVPALYAEYARTRAQVGAARTQAALGFVQMAAIRVSNLRSYIEEAAGWVTIANGFATDAVQRINMGQTIIAQSQSYITELEAYIAEAAQYQQTVANDLVLADRFRAEGQLRLAQFHDILTSKAEYRKRVSSIPVRQPA